MTQDKSIEAVVSALTDLRMRLDPRQQSILDGLILSETPEVMAHALIADGVTPFAVTLQGEVYVAKAQA